MDSIKLILKDSNDALIWAGNWYELTADVTREGVLSMAGSHAYSQQSSFTDQYFDNTYWVPLIAGVTGTWDGTKWVAAGTETPMNDFIRPMIEESAAKYAKEKGITPKKCD